MSRDMHARRQAITRGSLIGRYDVSKRMLKPPLLDPSVPDTQLAGWIDAHTMRVHQFLEKLDKVNME